MASTLLLDDFNERSKMTEKKYKQKLRSLIGGDSYQDAVDDMVEAEGGKLTNTVSHQGKSPEKYQQDVDRMVERGAQLRKRQSKKDNDKMLKEGDPRQTYEKGGLPDLTGDGKVTQADVLKGRGVFNEGSLITRKEKQHAIKQAATDIFSKYSPDDMPINIGFLPPVRMAVAELKDGANIKDVKKSMTDSLMFEYFPEEYKDQEQQEIKAAAKQFPTKKGDDRKNKAEGSLMMPEEGMPVDTYDNIPPEEMDEAMASQLPDDDMEDEYLDYVIGESLDDSEQQYLAQALENDPQLGNILDKVMTVASEFSGAGEVDGPGTGVSDSIPARLSDGEFVITKKATDQIGADNLQVMMDEAERAYDGGYQMKAIGGYMEEDPEEQDSPLSQTDEEIKKLMMGANKMPSLR